MFKPLLWGALALSLLAAPVLAQTATLSPALQAAVSKNALRSPEDMARDVHRKPDQILNFWGIAPGAKVADLGAGGGYYTKILAAYLKQGHVAAINSDFMAQNERFAASMAAMNQLAADHANVSHWVGRFDALALPTALDGALFVNFYHDTLWLGYDRAKMNRDIYQALKPGGTLLIIDHEAPWASGFTTGKTLHRIDSQALLSEVLEAGFHLIKSSPILQRPDDLLSESAVDAEQRRGQTSRFVYLFQKPTP